MPHTLVAKIRGAVEEQEAEGQHGGEEPALVDTEDTFITLRTDADLARAFDEAERAGQMVQVRVPFPPFFCDD